MEDRDRERLERLLDAITLAGNADMVREEIAELRALAVRAEDVERAGVEAKLAKLAKLLRRQGFFDRPDQRLVLFTEFKDTLDYLIEKLEAWGFKVASIHGGMKPGSRDEPGTRLLAEQQFREGAVQVLVATEAAGEGNARFLRDAAPLVPLRLDFIGGLPHTFEPARTPASLRRYERESPWRLPEMAARYPRCSTDRDNAQKHALEWVTPGHPLFEAIRRHARERALDPLARGATFHSLAHEAPARIDFYRARVVDGLGRVVHERVFALELAGDGEPRRCEPGVLGDLAPAPVPDVLPEVAHRPEPAAWLQERVPEPFLEETRVERLAEVERVADRGQGPGRRHRHDPVDAQRAPGRGGPARLPLAVRRHRLRQHAGSPRADRGPGAVSLERGEEGTALPFERRRHDAADAGTGAPAGLHCGERNVQERR